MIGSLLGEEWIMNFNSSEIREMRRAGYGGVIQINGKQSAGCFGSLEVANSNESYLSHGIVSRLQGPSESSKCIGFGGRRLLLCYLMGLVLESCPRHLVDHIEEIHLLAMEDCFFIYLVTLNSG